MEFYIVMLLIDLDFGLGSTDDFKLRSVCEFYRKVRLFYGDVVLISNMMRKKGIS